MIFSGGDRRTLGVWWPGHVRDTTRVFSGQVNVPVVCQWKPEFSGVLTFEDAARYDEPVPGVVVSWDVRKGR